MAKHALLSASGAHRWLECTPSALLELQFPQSTSEYAEEGTAAHELCELTARYFLGEVSEMDFENRRDELAKGPYYNAEMQECANDYARFVTEKTKAAQESCEDAFTELEVRVDFSKYVKDGFGTGDCIIVADKVLEIVDFKYGKGVRVEATGNPQMKLYALGALLKYNTLFDIDSVRMTIFQPRLSGIPTKSPSRSCSSGLRSMSSPALSWLIRAKASLPRPKRSASSAGRKLSAKREPTRISSSSMRLRTLCS